MIARIRKAMEEKDQGFTLIELLVVMVIVGILSAIAIPTFLNQRQKARETAAVADASAIAQEVATYWVDGTSTPTLTYASSVWTLAGTTTATGKLSTGDTIATGAILTSGSSFCFQVATGTSGDKVAQATSTGVTKVASSTACVAG